NESIAHSVSNLRRYAGERPSASHLKKRYLTRAAIARTTRTRMSSPPSPMPHIMPPPSIICCIGRLCRAVQVAPSHRTDPSIHNLAGPGSHHSHHGTAHAHVARASAASRYVEFTHVAYLHPSRIVAVVDSRLTGFGMGSGRGEHRRNKNCGSREQRHSLEPNSS